LVPTEDDHPMGDLNLYETDSLPSLWNTSSLETCQPAGDGSPVSEPSVPLST